MSRAALEKTADEGVRLGPGAYAGQGVAVGAVPGAVEDHRGAESGRCHEVERGRGVVDRERKSEAAEPVEAQELDALGRRAGEAVVLVGEDEPQVGETAGVEPGARPVTTTGSRPSSSQARSVAQAPGSSSMASSSGSRWACSMKES